MRGHREQTPSGLRHRITLERGHRQHAQVCWSQGQTTVPPGSLTRLRAGKPGGFQSWERYVTSQLSQRCPPHQVNLEAWRGVAPPLQGGLCC